MLIGNTSISTQLDWCRDEGADQAIFTHCGSEIVKADPRSIAARVRWLGRERGVAARVAYDGLRLARWQTLALTQIKAALAYRAQRARRARLSFCLPSTKGGSRVNRRNAVLFPHGADIGVRGLGTTREEAFAEAASALASAVVEPQTVSPRDLVEIDCAAPDDRLLFCDWLNAVIYEMAVRRMVFCRFAVSLQGQHLHGKAWGEAIDPGRHTPSTEAKGATMSGLKVEQLPDGTWVAECIVDV